ncbi:hypothetical protein SERLA73DRAFT_81445, partial [Serpula lacrymans var. lacrymans S7.3]
QHHPPSLNQTSPDSTPENRQTHSTKPEHVWLQFYAESHPQLIPRTQHDPPVTTENIYNEDDFEEYAAEDTPHRTQPISYPTYLHHVKRYDTQTHY